MPTPVDPLMWGVFHFSYNGHGCQEPYEFLEPPPDTVAGLDAYETMADRFNKLSVYRAALLPKGSRIEAGIVGYKGKPADSLEAMSDYGRPLQSGSTYKFGEPDNMNSCWHIKLYSANNKKSDYYLRLLEDDAVSNNFVAQGSPGLVIKPVSPPALPVFTDTKLELVRKWLQALMFYSVRGVRNPVSLLPNPPGGTLPWAYDNWRRAVPIKLTTRKMGRIYRSQKGRKAAFT